MAIATVHSARSDVFSVLWLEPAYGLVYVLRGSVDIAVLDRTGAVLQVFSKLEDSANTPGHVSKRVFAKSPIAVVGRSGTLGERLVPGMVLFWQDRPLVPLARPTPGQDPAPDEVPDWAPALGLESR